MKTLFIQLAIALLIINNVTAQDSTVVETSSPLEFSGSVDVYYKYDFSGKSNIGTSFAGDHNSFSIGMFNLIASKTVGKASFVADIGMGPRNAASVGPSGTEFQPGIQNLYVSYDFSDKFNITAGYMGTFVGYEVISPTGNFNYSTSYMFTNGPFQNAGVRATYAFSDKVSLMAGVFNDWNVYNQDPESGINSIGGQLAVSPVDGWDIYINGISGANDGYEIDLTTGYQITDEFYAGLNAAKWSYAIPESTDIASFAGAAVYLQYAFSEGFALGTRAEMFTSENTEYIGVNPVSLVEANNVTSLTLSANIGSGSLKFIPEIRFDAASDDVFLDADDNPTGSAVQGLVAAVFSF